MAKTCTVCKLNLPVEAFNKASKAKDGLQVRCRECSRLNNLQWYQNNKEHHKVKVLSHRKDNPDLVSYWRKKWQQTEQYREYSRMYQLNYRKLFPDRVKATETKRNQTDTRKHSFKLKTYRRRGAVGSHSLAEWQEKLAEYHNKCAYCTQDAATRDHRIPLIKGGTNFIDNIVPACFSCNSSKGAKTDMEFIAWQTR